MNPPLENDNPYQSLDDVFHRSPLNDNASSDYSRSDAHENVKSLPLTQHSPDVIKRIVAALVDDYYRQGESLNSEQVLRLTSKNGLDAEGHLEVRAELESLGVRVEEPEEDEFEEFDASEASGTVEYDSIRSYLREIGNYPLLNAKQEVILGRQIEAGKKAQALLEQKPNHARKHLIERLIAQGNSARDQLTTSNLRLVVSIAKMYVGRSDLELLDLIQEGSRGLIDAVERFDYRRGFKFSTYATWWIHQRVGRALADLGRTIRLPVHIVEKLHKIFRTQRALRAEWPGHEPTAAEISEYVDLPPAKVQFLLEISRQPERLDAPLGFEDGTTLADRVTSPSLANPEQIFMQTYLSELISESVEQLTPREEKVLRERFGLDDGREKTLEEIGLELGVTRERIRQIEAKALERMRHPLRASKLSEFWDE